MRKTFLNNFLLSCCPFDRFSNQNFANVSTVSKLLTLLVHKHSATCSSVQDVVTVVTSLVTIRVTAASAEQTFQNLIKLNRLRSAMA
jgi:hypothetical protein